MRMIKFAKREKSGLNIRAWNSLARHLLGLQDSIKIIYYSQPRVVCSVVPEASLKVTQAYLG